MSKPLRAAEARYQRAHAALKQAEEARNDAIRSAHADGMTTRSIAEHVSVSHQRVAQIVKP